MIKKSIIFIVALLSVTSTKYQPNSLDITTQIMAKEIACMAKNIYFEAGTESYEGKQAVSQVVINRTNDPRYPSNVCDVIYQHRKWIYQFSWVGKKKKHIEDPVSWGECVEVATNTMDQSVSHKGIAKNKALFYHAQYVNPKWKLRKVAHIGKHIFYTDDKA